MDKHAITISFNFDVNAVQKLAHPQSQAIPIHPFVVGHRNKLLIWQWKSISSNVPSSKGKILPILLEQYNTLGILSCSQHKIVSFLCVDGNVSSCWNTGIVLENTHIWLQHDATVTSVKYQNNKLKGQLNYCFEWIWMIWIVCHILKQMKTSLYAGAYIYILS